MHSLLEVPGMVVTVDELVLLSGVLAAVEAPHSRSNRASPWWLRSSQLIQFHKFNQCTSTGVSSMHTGTMA
jgi:hypothetical protein